MNYSSGSLIDFSFSLRILNDLVETMEADNQGVMDLQEATVKVIAVDGKSEFSNQQYLLETGASKVPYDVDQQAYVFSKLSFIGIPGGPLMTLGFSSPSVQTIQANDPYMFSDSYVYFLHIE
jgi:hypothetical protein